MTSISPFERLGSAVVREWPWPAHPEVQRFGVRGHYVERFWLPQLGPTALLLLRLLAELIEESGDGQRLELNLVSAALGVGSEAAGARSVPARALRRLERFKCVHLDVSGELMVRVDLPLISDRDAARLPPSLHAQHQRAIGST